MAIRENDYQAQLIKKLRVKHPDWIILKNDSAYLQGVPDWTILYKDNWAWFDVKRSSKASHRPNQDWYIDIASQWGVVSMFVYPENEEEFIDAIESALGS